MMPEIIPKSLERVGSKIPRNIISSNNGANRVVVTNNKKNKVKINTKREILMVSKIWCINLILIMDIFLKFLLSYETFFLN